jgi:hypothetical protein
MTDDITLTRRKALAAAAAGAVSGTLLWPGGNAQAQAQKPAELKIGIPPGGGDAVRGDQPAGRHRRRARARLLRR